MAKNKDNNKDKGEASKPKRGEVVQAMSLLRKARRVARSSGKLALEAYVAKNVSLKVYFPKDIQRLIATTWTPKPKATATADSN